MGKVILKQEGDSVSIIVSDSIDMREVVRDNEYNAIDEEDLPNDREFRDAWKLDGSIDLEKAKTIWRNKLRHARIAPLAVLDIEWLKAMEKGNVKQASAIANKKQTLRDITKREEISKATTIEEIKAFWPDELEG